MPRLPRAISCDRKGCDSTLTEDGYGQGHPEWGGLLGILMDDLEVILCPACLKDVCGFLGKGI